MSLKTINWIMGFLQNASFMVLINGSPSHFFKGSRGHTKGCPLSPYPFLIIVEALSMMIKESRVNGVLRGILVKEREVVSHILFIDDIFFYVYGS
jgi:hypothetical protein